MIAIKAIAPDYHIIMPVVVQLIKQFKFFICQHHKHLNIWTPEELFKKLQGHSNSKL